MEIKLRMMLDTLVKDLSVRKNSENTAIFADISISMRAHLEKFVKNDQKEPVVKFQ